MEIGVWVSEYQTLRSVATILRAAGVFRISGKSPSWCYSNSGELRLAKYYKGRSCAVHYVNTQWRAPSSSNTSSSPADYSPIHLREFFTCWPYARPGVLDSVPRHVLLNNTQAIFRGHVGRRFAAYCATYYNAARAIQSGARGFLARCRTRSARAARTWVLCGLPALLLIQRVVRGFLVRKAFARRFEEAVRVRVVIPAAGVLQKCWRGRLGRNDAALRRKMKAAATEIQVNIGILSRNG